MTSGTVRSATKPQILTAFLHMSHSALEIELLSLLHNLHAWLKKHDRGVLVGVLLSFIPFPPILAIALLIGFFNYFLLKKSKLDTSEKRLISIGLTIAIANLCFSSFAIYYLLHASMSVKWNEKFRTFLKIPEWYLYLFDSFKNSKRIVI